MTKNTQTEPALTHKSAALFKLLPDKVEKSLLTALSYESCPKGTLLIEQDVSLVEKFYLLSKGKVCFYYETARSKILSLELFPGDHFGGLSILYNNAIAIRSLEVVEDAVFASLDAEHFKKTCQDHSAFRDHFATQFGQCMLDKAFANILWQQAKQKIDTLPFFNRPIWSVFTPKLVTCSTDTSIGDAVQKMSRNNTSAILVRNESLSFEGIVTDADIRSKVTATDVDLSEPVSKIMASPLISISADAQVFEAFLAMDMNNTRHIAVRGQLGGHTGIIRQKDLIKAQTRATYLLIKTIKAAQQIRDLENIHTTLESMLLDPIKNGVNPKHITLLIATLSDAIIDRIISFALENLGPAPCKFVFVTMGSEGRKEQTLISDQDNAIIFEDTDDPEQAKTYFDKLACHICDDLDTAGYQFCKGGNMAKNTKWCQPISQWKTYFNTWIRTSNPENLLHSSIFFDFRGTWGHTPLAQQLKTYLMTSVSGWSGFFRNLSENAQYFKPPITRFGKFITQTKGPHKGLLDIKLAMLPMVDFARIYALKYGITQTNTLDRLFRLYIRHVLTWQEHTDIMRAYDFMMRLRFLNQITAIMDEKREPDNYINPSNLSSLDQTMLKEILKIMEDLQGKLGMEFIGVI